MEHLYTYIYTLWGKGTVILLPYNDDKVAFKRSLVGIPLINLQAQTSEINKLFGFFRLRTVAIGPESIVVGPESIVIGLDIILICGFYSLSLVLPLGPFPFGLSIRAVL